MLLTVPLETGGILCHAGPQGKAPVSVRRQKGKTEVQEHSLYWGFCRRGKAGQGKQLIAG